MRRIFGELGVMTSAITSTIFTILLIINILSGGGNENTKIRLGILSGTSIVFNVISAGIILASLKQKSLFSPLFEPVIEDPLLLLSPDEHAVSTTQLGETSDDLRRLI